MEERRERTQTGGQERESKQVDMSRAGGGVVRRRDVRLILSYLDESGVELLTPFCRRAEGPGPVDGR